MVGYRKTALIILGNQNRDKRKLLPNLPFRYVVTGSMLLVLFLKYLLLFDHPTPIGGRLIFRENFREIRGWYAANPFLRYRFARAGIG